MKFNAKTLLCAILAALMVVSLAAPAFAYQSAFKNGAAVTEFNDTAKAKMAAMKDGDNIMALGEYDTATYTSPAAYSESGYAQLVHQHNDNKWGRAYKGTWSINGMMNVCDGVIDVPTTGGKPANCLIFSRKESDVFCDPNGVANDAGIYTTLCGWEFAANFKVKGFKIYFASDAYADDFDILVGHLENDEIVWEVAYTANNIGSKLVPETSFTNSISSFSATFCKTMEGRFLQIATKGFEGMSLENKSGYYSYVCPEFEVYSGTTTTKHAAAEAIAAVPATCVNTGIAAHYACPACGQKYSDAAGTKAITAESVIVPATGIHTISVVKTPASCTAAGLADYYTCANCDTIFADSEGKTAIALADVAVIPATGHKFVNGVCSNCGAACQTISSEAEFLAMDPAGIYAVAKDFTLSTTYNYIDPETSAAVPFTGELIGNGHTITTTVPLFAAFDGSVTDLTVDGNIVVTDDYAAAFAQKVSSFARFDNCVNNANVTGEITGTSTQSGGAFIGYASAGSTDITITNCVNNGSVIATSQTGSLIGYAQGQTVTIDNCVNNGYVQSTMNYAGGIIGRFGKDASTSSYILRVTNTVNNGNVHSFKSETGGVIGYSVGYIFIDKCVNNGNIDADSGVVGGIFGKSAKTYTSGSSTKDTVNSIVITNCKNYGTITGVGNTGGIAAHMGQLAAKGTYRVENCTNYGDVILKPTGTGAVYASGIVAYIYGGKTENGVINCTNEGDVSVDSSAAPEKAPIVGGIIGYVNSSTFDISGNTNTGDISADNGQVYELFYNKATGSADRIHDNKVLKKDGVVYEFNGAEDTAPSYTFISAILYGDANGDGSVDMKDLALIRAYIANLDPDTGTSVVALQPGADCDGDGTVIAKDLMYLRAYIANYDQNTKTSTVVLGPQ